MSKKTHKEKEKLAEEVSEGAVEAEIKEEASGEEEEGLVDESKLPFPRATIVNMMRKHLSPGKQIKGQVKDEMNIWLGKMVERISKKMDSYPYTYVDYSMFKEAVETYEKVQDIELEKERIIKYLEKIKADCDSLAREVDRKFQL
ncbi:MAG: hypothetical protein V1672_01815 [Candidatus Diapherotrites archaeon]